ncbi:MAG: hypothetical protein HKO56_04510 [Bacteroidia bacterium]|nr:hypothetical protein [Bacteroidia bacterium]
MKYYIIVLLLLFSQTNYAYAQNSITPSDLKVLQGDWTGSLTYIDYRSNKPYTMPADLVVKQGNNENQLSLHNSYPNEPKANNKEKIKISKEGDYLNKKPIKSIDRSTEGQIQITTEYTGKDNNQEALIRNVYILGENQFIIKKEVKFDNSDKWLKRNEFNYKRKL